MGGADVCLRTRGGAAGRQFVGEMADSDQSFPTEDKRPLDHILEFPDIARPLVGHEQGNGLGGDAPDGSALQPVEPLDELVRQERDVLLAPAERREFHPYHVDPVVEVFPEAPCSHPFRQVSIGGDDHPCIHRLGSRSPQRLIGLLLKDTQQPHLERRADLPNLVEKNAPAFRQGEAARLVLARPREGTGLVTEQLGFEKRIRQGPAVHGNEGTFPSGAQVVDRPGDQFLARSRFAKHQDRARACRDGRHNLEDPLHQGAPAHEVADPHPARQLLAQGLHLGEIPEGLGAPDHPAVCVLEHRRGDADGDAIPISIDDVSGFSDDGPAGFQGFLKRTAVAAHAGPEHLRAGPSDGLPTGNAGDLLGGPVEGGDAPVHVHGEDAVGDALQNSLVGCCDPFTSTGFSTSHIHGSSAVPLSFTQDRKAGRLGLSWLRLPGWTPLSRPFLQRPSEGPLTSGNRNVMNITNRKDPRFANTDMSSVSIARYGGDPLHLPYAPPPPAARFESRKG